mgnify:CR=1 FL=1
MKKMLEKILYLETENKHLYESIERMPKFNEEED